MLNRTVSELLLFCFVSNINIFRWLLNKSDLSLHLIVSDGLRLTLLLQVYEEIAGHFSNTRHTPWPRVVDFLKQLPPGALVADVGCGNGKYLSINPNVYIVRILHFL